MVNKTKTSSNTSHDDILDSFLTTIESKLRGPFSSLDLAKAVSTAALRQSSQIGTHSRNNAPNDVNDPAREYLHNLSSVLGRTNKVIQCRMLIGLLGLNDMRTNKNLNDTSYTDNTNDNNGNDTSSQYLTSEILRILHETQETETKEGKPIHEEWVRTTSGLIEGVMFRTKDGADNGNTRESCRGNEAARVIRDTGTEVCEKVERQIHNAGRPYLHKHRGKQQNAAATPTSASTIQADSGTSSGSLEKKKSNPPTSAAAANKRNRGFAIEKVKASSSSQPVKKKEEQFYQPPIKQEQKPSVVERTEPAPPDLNACFAPYRYRLIPTPVLNTIIPEFELSKDKSNGNSSNNGISNSNCHFQVNAAADILKVDLKLEAQRAKEHGSNVSTKPSNNSDGRIKKDPTVASVGGSGKSTFPPGFRPAKLVPTNAAGASKGVARSGRSGSNLFNKTTQYRPQKALIGRRKGGGAQALLKKGATASGGGTILNKLGNGGAPGSGSVGGGRKQGGVGRFSSNRDASRGGVGRSSRMKMIDDDDVDTLTKLRRSNANNNMTAAELRASKRKLILEKAAQRGIHGSGGGRPAKKQKVVSSSHAAARQGVKLEKPATPSITATTTEPRQPQQQPNTIESWQTLLRDRSNKMSEDDRIKVKKFFTTTDVADRSALLLPSEGGTPVTKMKIHEQRSKDPATGQDIKETFYLELDYGTGASKQSKKTKRY